jgi:hypothetical protein
MSSQRYQRTVLDEVFFVPLQSGVVWRFHFRQYPNLYLKLAF